MDTLEEIMFRQGLATFQKRKPSEDLSKYVPIRVTEANLGDSGGLTPNQLIGAPEYVDQYQRSIERAKENNTVPNWMKPSAPREQGAIFVSNKAEGDYREYVKQHEQSHVLSHRSLPQDLSQTKHPLYKKAGEGVANTLFEDLRRAIKKNGIELMQKYPELYQSAYMERPYHPNTSLEEIMADLNAIEDIYGVDLTKEPLLSGAFWSTKNREAYKASTGYRRTRMDARDPEPYNPQGYK